MNQSQFTVEFYSPEKSSVHTNKLKLFKYSACISIISKSFQLFQVSGIKKIDKDSIENLPGEYYVTSYPYNKAEEQKWTDASTLKSNTFVNKLGAAIDNSIFNAAFN